MYIGTQSLESACFYLPRGLAASLGAATAAAVAGGVLSAAHADLVGAGAHLRNGFLRRVSDGLTERCGGWKGKKLRLGGTTAQDIPAVGPRC
jgi:hypothetical protein